MLIQSSAVTRRSRPSAVGITGSVTVSGSGFGTNANYSPVSFIDFIGLSNGDSWSTAGFDHYNPSTSGSHYTASIAVLMDDGLPIGGGCIETQIHGDNANAGGGSDGPFFHLGINTGDQIALTVFKHVKFLHLSGTVASECQYKSTRLCTDINGAAYGATPKLAASFFTSNATSGYNTPHYWREGGGETGVTRLTNPQPWGGDWMCMWTQGALNSADNVADGIYREWAGGGYVYNNTALDLRDTMTEYFKSAQHNPGLANSFGSTGEWRVRHARVVTIAGLGWCAIGNASTFSACTDLLVVEPTAWSDTQITANTHGTIPSGYNWAYVMDTSGVLVNSSGIAI